MNKYLLASMLFVTSDVFGITEIANCPNNNRKRSFHYKNYNKRLKSSVNDIDTNGNAALHREIVKARTISAEIESLIKRGADVNQQNKNGDSPAKMAFMRNNQDLVKYLIEKGADINRQDRHGHTLLHFAALENNEEVLTYFIENGAKINQEDNYGRTPLHFVAQWGNDKMAAHLIRAGAKINKKDKNGYTPLNVAKRERNEKMIDYLTKNNRS